MSTIGRVRSPRGWDISVEALGLAPLEAPALSARPHGEDRPFRETRELRLELRAARRSRSACRSGAPRGQTRARTRADAFSASSPRESAPTEVQSWVFASLLGQRRSLRRPRCPATGQRSTMNSSTSPPKCLPLACPATCTRTSSPSFASVTASGRPVGAHEPDGLGVLEHRRPLLAVGLRLYHDQRPPLHLYPPDDGVAPRAGLVHELDLVAAWSSERYLVFPSTPRM